MHEFNECASYTIIIIIIITIRHLSRIVAQTSSYLQ
jgi:hypothetical protein